MREIIIPGVEIVYERIPDGTIPVTVVDGKSYCPAEIEIKTRCLKRNTLEGIDTCWADLEANIRFMLYNSAAANKIIIQHRGDLETHDCIKKQDEEEEVFICGTFAVTCIRTRVEQVVTCLESPFKAQELKYNERYQHVK